MENSVNTLDADPANKQPRSRRAVYVHGIPVNALIGHGPISDLPPGAKVMSLNHVRVRQDRIMHNWTPQYETWPIRYGSPVMGVASSLCGLFMHQRFRRTFNLTRYVIPSTMMVGLPSAIGILMVHTWKVTERVRFQLSKCELCDALRSSCLGVVLGAFVPTFAAVLVATSTASMTHSYKMPHLSENTSKLFFTKKIFGFMGKHVILERKALLTCCIVQFFVGEFVAWAQLDSARKINMAVINSVNGDLISDD